MVRMSEVTRRECHSVSISCSSALQSLDPGRNKAATEDGRYFSLFGIFSCFPYVFSTGQIRVLSLFSHILFRRLWLRSNLRDRPKLYEPRRNYRQPYAAGKTFSRAPRLPTIQFVWGFRVIPATMRCNGWEYQLRYCTNYTNSCTCSLKHLMSESNIRAKVHEHSQNCSITFSRFLLKSSADFQGV